MSLVAARIRALRGCLKLLTLIPDYHDYLERMNTHTYEIVDSALRHPLIEDVDVWGPGWSGWHPDLDIGENVRRRMWRIAELERDVADRSRAEEEAASDEAKETRGTGIQRDEDDWAGVWASGRSHSGQSVVAGAAGLGGNESTIVEGVKMDKWIEAIGSVPEGCPAERFDLVWTIS